MITICFIAIVLIGLISHLCVAKRKLRHLELSIARLKNFDHHCSTEEVVNADYATITGDQALKLDGNLKIPATVTSDVSCNTPQCSVDAFNRSAEIITTKGDEPISEVQNIKIQKNLHSLSIDQIKFTNHDTTAAAAEFNNNNINRKLQEQIAVSVNLDQLSDLSKRIGKIQRSSSEMALRKPPRTITRYSLCNEADIFIRNADATATPTNEQTVDTFSEDYSDDPVNDLIDDTSQSLQPVHDMQDYSNGVATTTLTLPSTSACDIQGSNEVETKQHEKTSRQQSRGLTLYNSTQYGTKTAHSFSGVPISSMHYDTPTSTIGCTNSNDEVKVSVNQNFKAPRLSHLVAIQIPYDDSGVPVVDKNTSIADEDIVTEYIATNSDEALELQSNPAYDTFDDITSEDHLYEEIF